MNKKKKSDYEILISRSESNSVKEDPEITDSSVGGVTHTTSESTNEEETEDSA